MGIERVVIKGKVSIDERPDVVDQKNAFGGLGSVHHRGAREQGGDPDNR
ncbi:MAG: hypothetical protein WCR12_07895 [Dysgonamonadaceae bacterium]